LTASEVLTAAVGKANAVGTKLLHMEPGDEWTPEAGVIRRELTRGWGNDLESVRRYAEQEKVRVNAAIARARSAGGLHVSPPTLERALGRYLGAMLEATRSMTAELKMIAGFSVNEAGWRVQFEPGRAPVIEPGLRGDEDEVFSVPNDELAAIVFGLSTWEDVWYGYRLQVTKRDGTGYYRAFWDMLLGFDDQAISSQLRAELAP